MFFTSSSPPFGIIQYIPLFLVFHRVTSTRFEDNVDVGAVDGDDFENCFWIVLDGLIGENVPLLIHDADLQGLGVVVNADENW